MRLDGRLVRALREPEEHLVGGARSPLVAAGGQPLGAFVERGAPRGPEHVFAQLAGPQEVEPSDERHEGAVLATLTVEAGDHPLHLPRLDPREQAGARRAPRGGEEQVVQRGRERLVAHRDGVRGPLGVSRAGPRPRRPASAAHRGDGQGSPEEQRGQRERARIVLSLYTAAPQSKQSDETGAKSREKAGRAGGVAGVAGFEATAAAGSSRRLLACIGVSTVLPLRLAARVVAAAVHVDGPSASWAGLQLRSRLHPPPAPRHPGGRTRRRRCRWPCR